MTHHWLRRSVCSLASCCLLGFAFTVHAETADSARLLAMPPDFRIDADPHVQSRPLTPDQLPPLPSTRDHLHRSYDDSRPAAPVVECDLRVFADASVAELPELVRSADLACINGLFYLDGSDAAGIVNEAKMSAVADAFGERAASYGGNNDDGVLQLTRFLRAGYYLQFYYPGDVGVYGPNLLTILRTALDAFIANAHFHDVNDEHGSVLAEFVILIDSSVQNAYALDAVRGILESYGPSWADHAAMLSAVNQCFWVLYRGHQNDDFAQLVQGAGSGIVGTLSSFIYDNAADLGSVRAYLIKNAGAELARFLMYGGALHSEVHPRVLSILQDFPLAGPGGGLYARVGAAASYYDDAHCAYFGVCDFFATLEASVLPDANAIDCGPTLRVRSQALTSEQLQYVCGVAAGEESYFHTELHTLAIPLANDYNDTLEMIVFRSSTDYENFSGILFGNSTNNGGVYLEGDASDPANQARFLCYQAEWLEPVFEIWNLTHEYVHYLDGRFDTAGNFADLPLAAPYSVVWYVEGVAEYLSYTYRALRYDAALTEAADPDRYTLTTLLDNEYADGGTRVYRWGYLAVRFLFERHREEIDTMLGLFRNFNYGANGYEPFVDAMRGTYDAEFRDWLVCMSAQSGDTTACDRVFAGDFEAPPECPSSNPGELGNHCVRSELSADVGDPNHFNAALFLRLPAGMSKLKLTTSGGTGDANLYVRKGAWPTDTIYDAASVMPGNNEIVTIDDPVGDDYYYVVITPNTSFSGVQIRSDWE